MTRDEIIDGFEREIRRIRREPKEKMLGVCITVDEAEEIVALLNGQEAKRVIGIADSIDGIEVGYCPSCDRAIVNKKIDETKFCRYCGQELKWK